MKNIYSLIIDGEQAIYRDAIEKNSVFLPVKNLYGLRHIREGKALASSALEEAVRSPNTGASLSDIVKLKKAQSACIIISDVTRGVPTAKVAPYIVRILEQSGIASENIFFLVALGVHRAASPTEMAEFVGGALASKYRVFNHDAFDSEKLVDLGTTSRGTRLIVNKLAAQADMRIIIGRVELHEFAGYSGGRKSVLPGIAAESTILKNHSPEWLAAKGAYVGNLNGNPIHLDMLEAARRLGVDFCVSFIVNSAGAPTAIFSGELESSHMMAAEHLARICSVHLKGKPDIIVTTCGKALGTELYQAIKPLISLTELMDTHTAFILYAPCPEGVNSPDMMEPFRSFASYDAIDDYVRNNFRIQMDHTLPMTRILRTGARLIAVTPGVADEDLRLLGFESAPSLQAAVDKAIAGHEARNPKVLFYPMAQRTLTYLD